MAEIGVNWQKRGSL